MKTRYTGSIRTMFYTKKLAKYIVNGAFITLNYEYRTAEFRGRRKDKPYAYYMKYDLAYDLVHETSSFILDSGNDYYREETYVVNRDAFMTADATKLKLLKQKLVDIFVKHDASRQILTKKDLMR